MIKNMKRILFLCMIWILITPTLYAEGSTSYNATNEKQKYQTFFNDFKKEIFSYQGKRVNVKDFPRLNNETNDTARINRALQSGATVVTIPNGEYWIDGWSEDSWTDFTYGGISLESNQALILGENTKLRLIPNDKAESTIIRVTGKKNVYIYGGQLIGDRYKHQGTTGQWGMGLSVIGSENVYIENVKSLNNWGDGFFIGHTSDGVHSKNVHLLNIESTNNRRQGLSVVASINGGIYFSKLSKTNGHSPEAGIDLEPNPSKLVENFKIIGCEIFDNAQQGIQVGPDFGLPTNGIVIYGNTIHNNGNMGVYIITGEKHDISFNRVFSNRANGIYLLNSNNNKVFQNQITKNFLHGIALGFSHENLVSKNEVSGNSQEKHNIYSNIILWGSNDNRIVENLIRRGKGSKQPKYGIRIEKYETPKRNLINFNDVYQGGYSSSISDEGINTIIGKGNRGYK